MLKLALLVTTMTACVSEGDDVTVDRYSCVLRFSCVDSGDVLARQALVCAASSEDATDAARSLGVQVAEERCGTSMWRFSWVTCDDDSVDVCD